MIYKAPKSQKESGRKKCPHNISIGLTNFFSIVTG